MGTTYLKLDRKLLNNKYFKYPGKANQLRVWLYLLMNAAYDAKDDDEIKRYGYDHIEPGQVIRSRDTIAHDLNLLSHQVKAALNALRKDNMITTKSSNKNTLITIVNWEIYQGGKKQNDQRNDQQNDQQKASQKTNKKPAKSPQTRNIYPTDIKEKEKEKKGAAPPSGVAPDKYGVPPDGWTDEYERQFQEMAPDNPGKTRQDWYEFWVLPAEDGDDG